MPGEGVLPVVDIIRTAYQAGFDGWYELEIFSDDGTFGTVLEDSLWQQPAPRVLAQGRAAFEKVFANAVGTIESGTAASPSQGGRVGETPGLSERQGRARRAPSEPRLGSSINYEPTVEPAGTRPVAQADCARRTRA